MEFTFDLQMFAAPVEGDVGQFKWNEVSNGLFSIKVNGNDTKVSFTATIADQATPVTVTQPKSGYNWYLQASYDDGTKGLEIDEIYGIDKDGNVDTIGNIYAGALTKCTISIKAPSDAVKIESLYAGVTTNITNLAADSTIKTGILVDGDTVKTAALKAGESITIGTDIYTSTAGALEFAVGETNRVALKNGAVVLATGGLTSLKLSSDTTATADLTSDGVQPVSVAVKTANGKVSSIKVTDVDDANPVDMTGVVVTLSGVKGGGYTDATIVYTALNAAGTMFSRAVTDNAVTTTTYLDLTKAGGELYSGAWKKAAATVNGNTFDFATAAKKETYKVVTANDVTKTVSDDQDLSADATSATINPAGVPSSDVWYLKITSTTDTKGVTTINNMDVYHAGANGALTKSNYKYTGIVTLPAAAGAIVKYTKPANSTFSVIANGVGLGSVFNNLQTGDQITTQAADYTAKTFKNGSYTIYNYNATFQETHKFTVSGGDGVTLTIDPADVDNNTVSGVKKGEKVTIESHLVTGLVTETIAMNKDKVFTKTIVLADGTKTVSVGESTDDDIANVGVWEDSVTFASTFDWSVNKNTTGYFAIGKNGVANVKAGTTTTITESNKGNNYVALAFTKDPATGAVTVNSLGAKTADYNSGTDTVSLADATTTAVINIAAPKGAALILDKATVAAGTTARLVITGVAKDSTFTALEANDSVSTASLTKGDSVTINTHAYTAGVNGALSFELNGADNEKLTKGTVTVAGATGSVLVGTKAITTTVAADSITVAANGDNFTVGDLDDGEKFTIGGVTYTKFGTSLYESVANKVYNLGTGKTITNANLDNTTKWSATAAATGDITVNLALADAKIAAVAKAGGAAADYDFAVDALATAAKATAARNGVLVADGGTPATYGTKAGDVDGTTVAAPAYAASVAQTIKVTKGWTVNGSDGADTIIGATAGTDILNGGKGDDKITLNGAADTVLFGDLDTANDVGADTVSGYASGKDAIVISAQINNTFDAILDTEKGGNVYLVKQGGTIADADRIKLMGVGNGKAVKIGLDADGDFSNLNDVDYADFYFANGSTNAAANFTYVADAHYYGNTNSTSNTLKVTTQKDARSKNNIVDGIIGVDLNDANGLYNNIDIVNASASANEVKLTALDTAAKSTTLMGGSYKSTLVGKQGDDTLQGGSGTDVFYVDASGDVGTDTIKNYTAGKDYVMVEDFASIGGVAAVGNDVVITGDNGGTITVTGGVNVAKPITVGAGALGADYDATLTAGVIGAAHNYYVGKNTSSTTSNTFTVDASKVAVASLEATNNYYVGNGNTSSATGKNMDTLKITGAYDVAGKLSVDLTAQDADTADYYTSIEAVDASGLKAGATVKRDVLPGNINSTMGVNVTASANGTRFTGSSFDDTFTGGAGSDYIIYKAGQGNDILTGLGVGDIIELNGLTDAEITNVVDTITGAGGATNTFAKGGNLTFDGGNTAVRDGNKITITG